MQTREQLLNANIKRLESTVANSAVVVQNGFDIDITTLTGIKQKVTEQKFFTLHGDKTPSDYLPVVVGDQAWSDELLTYKDFSIGGDFETGLIDNGSGAGRLETMDTKIDAVKVKVKDWGKEINYNLIELNKASRAGNWSLVESKEKSRFKNWQLGIQRTAFLGLDNDSEVEGLLTSSEVAINTTLITKKISLMNATEFQTLIASINGLYFDNSNNTAMPTHFVMPTDDFLGLASATDEGFPLKNRYERLMDAFTMATGSADFKILPVAYAQANRNELGVNRYALYNYDEESVRMDIPVDYTTTVTDTIDGFKYNSVAYGEFTGVKFYRPLECLYFDWS